MIDRIKQARATRVLRDRAIDPALGQLHCTPDFIIIGAARSGTTSVLNYLRRTPGVLRCPTQELHFFDSARFSRGMGWYRQNFPWAYERRLARARGVRPAITGENSPFYLAHPGSPERVRDALPDVRLIALLRDPTDRAVSHWNWRVNRKHESREFEEAARSELARLRVADGTPSDGGSIDEPDEAGRQPLKERRKAYRAQRFESYIGRGLYLEQLKRWHGQFGRDRLLVLISEEFYADPMTQMQRVWRHLDLAPLGELPPIHKNAIKNRLPVDAEIKEEIREFCRPHNAALAEYLGVTLPWR